MSATARRGSGFSITSPVMRPIAIACGDPTGIGPEIALKAASSELQRDPDFRATLIGDRGIAQRWNDRLGLHLSFAPTEPSDSRCRLDFFDPRPAALSSGIRSDDPVAAAAPPPHSL